jgi:hypothetical protein
VYEASVTSTVPGSFVVSVRAGQVDVPHGLNNAVAVFVAGDASPADSSVEVTTSGDKVAGLEAHEVKLTVVDTYGHRLGGESVHVWVVPQAAPVFDTNVTTGLAGEATVEFTSQAKGVYTVYATLGGEHLDGSGVVSASFVAGPAHPAVSVLSGTTGSARLAGGVARHTATVHALDAVGNDVAGAVVEFALSGVGGFVTPSRVQTDADGLASVDLTSPSVGNTIVTARVNSEQISVGMSPAYLSFVWVPGSSNPGLSSYEATSGSRVAGSGTEWHEVFVTLRDGAGVLVPGEVDRVDIEATDGVATATVSGWHEVGVGVYGAKLHSDVAGRFALRVSWAGLEIGPELGSPSSVVFVPGEVDFGPAHSSFAVTTGNVVADGVASHTVTVTLRDAFDNGVPGLGDDIEVGVSSDVAKSAVRDGGVDGEYLVELTAVKAGTYPVTVKVDGEDVGPGSGNADAVFVSFPAGFGYLTGFWERLCN